MIVIESNQNHAVVKDTEISPALPASMGMGGGYVPMILEDKSEWTGINGDVAETLDANYFKGSGSRGNKEREVIIGPFCIGNGQLDQLDLSEKVGALNCMHDQQAVLKLKEQEEGMSKTRVRRLTPKECERLQGFPDDWTNIGDWTDSKGKKHKTADSPRYKALGNSCAIPAWIDILQAVAERCPEGQKTLGSLFDGIAAFPLIWERICGGKAVWASEIEEFCIAVTRKHFPEDE